MARRPAPRARAHSRRSSGGDGGWTPLWFAVTVVLVSVVSLPSVILVFFGMLPALVAWVVDRTGQKYSVYCVGGLNLCGLYPYLSELWSGAHTVSQAFDILTNVFALFAIYGAAAIGWMIYTGVPPVVGAVLTMLAQRRLGQLRAVQRNLVEEWGKDVGG